MRVRVRLRVNALSLGTLGEGYEGESKSRALKRGDVVLATIVGVSLLCSYCITSPLCALRVAMRVFSSVSFK